MAVQWTKELGGKLKPLVAHGFVFTVVAERLGAPLTGKDVLARMASPMREARRRYLTQLVQSAPNQLMRGRQIALTSRCETR